MAHIILVFKGWLILSWTCTVWKVLKTSKRKVKHSGDGAGLKQVVTWLSSWFTFALDKPEQGEGLINTRKVLTFRHVRRVDNSATLSKCWIQQLTRKWELALNVSAMITQITWYIQLWTDMYSTNMQDAPKYLTKVAIIMTNIIVIMSLYKAYMIYRAECKSWNAMGI